MALKNLLRLRGHNALLVGIDINDNPVFLNKENFET